MKRNRSFHARAERFILMVVFLSIGVAGGFTLFRVVSDSDEAESRGALHERHEADLEELRSLRGDHASQLAKREDLMRRLGEAQARLEKYESQGQRDAREREKQALRLVQAEGSRAEAVERVQELEQRMASLLDEHKAMTVLLAEREAQLERMTTANDTRLDSERREFEARLEKLLAERDHLSDELKRLREQRALRDVTEDGYVRMSSVESSSLDDDFAALAQALRRLWEEVIGEEDGAPWDVNTLAGARLRLLNYNAWWVLAQLRGVETGLEHPQQEPDQTAVVIRRCIERLEEYFK